LTWKMINKTVVGGILSFQFNRQRHTVWRSHAGMNDAGVD
jgi:hypothetical protein